MIPALTLPAWARRVWPRSLHAHASDHAERRFCQGNSRYQSPDDYVKLRPPYSIFFHGESGEEPCLTKRNAGIRLAPVRLNPMASTVARHVKAPARRLNSIVIADTIPARETFRLWSAPDLLPVFGDHQGEMLSHRGIEIVKSFLLLLRRAQITQNQIANSEIVIE